VSITEVVVEELLAVIFAELVVVFFRWLFGGATRLGLE